MTSIVHVEVSGLTGSGKSAVMGEIEIALKALGLKVETGPDFQAEKNGTHADWQTALDLYQPTVVLTERNISCQPQAREDAQPVGWLRAADEEMVCAHLGVAEAGDSYETAKQKLTSLIQWNIAVAMDPSVGGHPDPDALRVAVEALKRIGSARDRRQPFQSDTELLMQVEHEASEALAALQAEQGAK